MNHYMIFRANRETEYAYDLTFNIEPESLAIQRHFVLSDGQKIQGKNFIVRLEELRARQEWKDACVWLITFRGENAIGMPGPVHDDLNLINFTAENFAARRDKRIFYALHPEMTLCCAVFVPFASSSFTEMFYQVNLQDQNATFRSNQNFVEHVSAGFGPGTGPKLESTEFFPTLVLNAPDSIPKDGWLEGTIQAFFDGEPLSDTTLEVLLDSLGGYLPKTRFTIGDTPAPFKLSAYGLESGDVIRLRGGFRYRSSVDEKLITVR